MKFVRERQWLCPAGEGDRSCQWDQKQHKTKQNKKEKNSRKQNKNLESCDKRKGRAQSKDYIEIREGEKSIWKQDSKQPDQ